MDEARKNRDFLKGPVWNPIGIAGWLKFGTKRFKAAEAVPPRARSLAYLVRGASKDKRYWHEQAPKTITFATALKQYREYSTVQNRSHRSYVEPALVDVGSAHRARTTLLAKITPAHIEDVKLRRAKQVAHSTVDKDLAVLESVLQLVHGAQSRRVESGAARQVFQRGQLATSLSHGGRVRPPPAGGEEDRDVTVPRREDHPVRAHGTAQRQPVPPSMGSGGLPQPRVSAFRGPRVAAHTRCRSMRRCSRRCRRCTASGIPDCPYVFAHATGRKAGEPVQDVKNAFHTALETRGDQGLHLA